jgi:hypothetical protein
MNNFFWYFGQNLVTFGELGGQIHQPQVDEKLPTSIEGPLLIPPLSQCLCNNWLKVMFFVKITNFW